jgi:hypothetical protein
MYHGFLLIWAGFIFVFFSLSQSKLVPYILPVFPPIAILTAHYLQNQNWQKKVRSFYILCLGSSLILITIPLLVKQVDTRTIKPLAMSINKLAKQGDKVVSYQHYYQDLPFYTRTRVYMSGFRSELDFGISLASDKTWVLNEQQFWHLWAGNQRVWAVTRKEDYEHMQAKSISMYKINETATDVLVSNQP